MWLGVLTTYNRRTPRAWFKKGQIDDFASAISILNGRQLFRTRAGRLGFTNVGVQPGDIVCLFTSAPVLHVIRKASKAGKGKPETWQFVGEAYVHDLMNGEGEKLGFEEGPIVLV